MGYSCGNVEQRNPRAVAAAVPLINLKKKDME
jgi:hypothetical protein